MFLETVGQDKKKRDIAARYQRSVDTVQRKLDDVLSAILKFVVDTLRPQEGEFGRVNHVLRNDDRYWPHFRDCIGALDGTHVPVRPPSQNAEAYRATMALHNFIRDSHREDHDFVQWQKEEEDDGDGGGGGHIVDEPAGDRAMEALCDNITNEYGRGRLPF
ncbi:hypothetical protein YC2023_049009 [Brassica napus]